MGVGGIKGSNDAPKATTLCEPAFLRPIDGQAVPRLREATTATVTTTTTTAMPTTSAAPLLVWLTHSMGVSTNTPWSRWTG